MYANFSFIDADGNIEMLFSPRGSKMLRWKYSFNDCPVTRSTMTPAQSMFTLNHNEQMIIENSVAS